MNIIGDNIKKIRLSKNMSTRKLAELAEISNGYISQLENGIDYRTKKPIKPTFDILQRIALGLRVDVNDLTGEIDSSIDINLNAEEIEIIKLIRHECITIEHIQYLAKTINLRRYK